MRMIILTRVVDALVDAGGAYTAPDWIAGIPNGGPNTSGTDLPGHRCVVVDKNPYAGLEAKRCE